MLYARKEWFITIIFIHVWTEDGPEGIKNDFRRNFEIEIEIEKHGRQVCVYFGVLSGIHLNC